MNRAIPFLAALQWLAGILLAYVAIGRARGFRRDGVWPLGIGRAALILFVIGALVLAVTLPAIARVLTRVFPAFATADRWRMDLFFEASQAGWVLVLISTAWNSVLGIIGRKRAARAELARRRARVRGGPHV